MELQGQVALITGAGRGIGKETAQLLAKQGAAIAVCALEEQQCIDVAMDIASKYGVKTMALTCDITDYAQVQQAVAKVKRHFGKIDLLINNAGGMLLKPFTEMSVEEWQWMQRINVDGAFYMCKEVVPHMIAAQSGCIINISSIWGTKGGPNRSAYITSKHAVIGFTKALGEELKPHRIRVNAVCPGPTNTQMTDDLGAGFNKDGWLEPIDIAHVIANLAMPQSRAVTATAVEAFGYGAPVGLS